MMPFLHYSLHGTSRRGTTLVDECNGDLSPVETIGGGLDYFRLADHRDIGLGGELMGRQAVRR
jgi:hypothetical protein